MFVSFTVADTNSFDPIGRAIFKYSIVDTDFNVDVENISICGAVIETYESRNLNVVANLIRMYVFICKRNKQGWKAHNFILWGNKWSYKFKQYEKDLSKYLALI